MTCRLEALCIDANDPPRLARFWSSVLGWEMADEPADGTSLMPNDDTGFQIKFSPTEAPKVGPNQMHLHLTSTSPEHQQQTVPRALGLGGRRPNAGERAEGSYIVLEDPEGNEFCVIEPGNKFLADCGFLGEMTCEGSQQTGYFWSAALGWPLVWDQDQETSIRSPHGGPKISWGGPPLTPKTGKYRLHFDLAPPVGTDPQKEIDRLISLGAKRVDSGQGDVSWTVMADPDDHEFRVLTPR